MSKPKGLAPEVLGYWLDEFEREMFPHQESEEEQEAFTDVGRKRVGRVIQRLVKAVRATEQEPAPTKGDPR